MPDLKRTPLYNLHVAAGAKMVPFAGYEMPVQYGLGVMKEHLWTRQHAGLFDVSHMGQIWVEGPDPGAALERLVPQSVIDLKDGRQRYGFLTNDAAGIIDDLMIIRVDYSRLHLVVNAAKKDEVLAHLREGMPECHVESFNASVHYALLALQGPQAEHALAQVIPGVRDMGFMEYRIFETDFGRVDTTRSGYTGEDGFELSLGADQAEVFAKALLAMDEVELIGLGARDSLRLEAGLCLYGNDIDTTTTPVEAALEWAMQKIRRTGGERAGGFPGSERILNQLDNGAPRRRVGLLPEGRAPMRAGTELFAGDGHVGTVTSGAYGPSLEAPMSMGYVATEHAQTGTPLEGEVRGKRMPVTVVDLPFRPSNYKR
ncbi:MAG: glycine cleavage system aminomethyltransferase GcvT [Pseudomonadota bacterium]